MKYLRNFNSRADWESALILDIPNISYIKDSGLIEYGKDYQIPSNYILYTTTYGGLLGNISNASKHYLHDGVGVVEYANPVENSPSFLGKHSLKSIIFPKGTKKIPTNSFYDCLKLNKVSMPEGLTEIGSYAFAHCWNLKDIIIPDSVSHIACGAFYDSTLQSIKLPANLSQIEDSVFENSSLLSIIIPNSVTSIGESAFYNCSSLTSITLPDGITSIGENAFLGTNYYNNSNWENDLLYIGNYLIKAKTEIADSCNIKSNCQLIADGAFIGCSLLTGMVVEDNNTVYDSREDCNAIIETATNTLIAGCQNTTIPDSVTSIGRSAFEDCQSLTSINIPNSVTCIEDRAFSGCNGLNYITIPNSVSSIGERVFSGCENLWRITIGANVTRIGYGNFNHNDLFSLTCLAINPPILEHIGPYLYNIYIYVPAESVDAYKQATNWSYYADKIRPIQES